MSHWFQNKLAEGWKIRKLCFLFWSLCILHQNFIWSCFTVQKIYFRATEREWRTEIGCKYSHIQSQMSLARSFVRLSVLSAGMWASLNGVQVGTSMWTGPHNHVTSYGRRGFEQFQPSRFFIFFTFFTSGFFLNAIVVIYPKNKKTKLKKKTWITLNCCGIIKIISLLKY